MNHTTPNAICSACHIGHLHLLTLTYSQVYRGTLVSVPNTPAWQCDYCHTIEYDRHAMLRIETLVDQAGPPPNHHVSRRAGQPLPRAKNYRPANS